MAVIILIWCPCAQSLLWRSDTGNSNGSGIIFTFTAVMLGIQIKQGKQRHRLHCWLVAHPGNLSWRIQGQQSPEDMVAFSHVDNLLPCLVNSCCCHQQIRWPEECCGSSVLQSLVSIGLCSPPHTLVLGFCCFASGCLFEVAVKCINCKKLHHRRRRLYDYLRLNITKVWVCVKNIVFCSCMQALLFYNTPLH